MKPTINDNANQLMGRVAFSGDFDPDVDAAARALERAGYQVFRPDEKYRKRYDHPLDDFIEARIEEARVKATEDEDPMGVVLDEVDAIVRPYGGLCDASSHDI
jgi:hypothetical protein